MTTPTPTIVREFATSALLLASALGRAEAVQWQPAPTPKPREDTTERSRGIHSDPTAQTATDPRRLALRAAVVTAELALAATATAAEDARIGVEVALRNYYGDLA